uniref:Calcineurin-like phosphoesterase domain-containing protein n=1 Tax=Mucochytrium quahogii TaxID=96639 RepID=A0A7S2SNH3_9STRA|mmetsp:Transcript_3564/g.6844  ORF Transcript_3564/g.6844 Transcript_3564/m.6844 type:complete len:596 (+) Transcript_3564:216-2003(+)
MLSLKTGVFFVAAVAIGVRYFYTEKDLQVVRHVELLGEDVQIQGKFSVLHTNDMHSHAERYSKLSRIIRNERSLYDESVLLIDAGDWYRGTMFDTLAGSDRTDSVPELEYFSFNSYDAVLLGNHAFDLGETVLAGLLDKASRSDLNLVFLSANVQIGPKSELFKYYTQDILVQPDTDTEENSVIIAPAILKTVAGRRVGILGIEGPDSAICSSAHRSNVTFLGYDDSKSRIEQDSLVDYSNKLVQRLRDKGAELVVLVIHAGPPEDVVFASRINADVVVGGHTHETLFSQLVKGDKLVPVVQCGEYASHIGSLELVFDGSTQGFLVGDRSRERILRDGHSCIPVDMVQDEYPNMKQLVEHWMGQLSKTVPSAFQYDQVVFDQPVSADGVFTDDDTALSTAEKVSTGVLFTLNNWLGENDQRRADVFLTCPECVRQPIKSTGGKRFKLKFHQVYELVALSGVKPLSAFYIQKDDFLRLIDVVSLLGKYFSERFQLAFSSNLQYDQNPWGIPFVNRVSNLTINGVEFENLPQLIKVALPQYIAAYFWQTKTLTAGLLDSPARGPNGGFITLDKAVIHSSPPEYELLAQYLAHISKNS